MILGFCVENPPQMGLGDPNAGGFGGGSRFLGVSGGLWVSILGFRVENPPQMGGETPVGGGLGEWGPHFWGSLGVDFGVLCGEAPQMGLGDLSKRGWGGSPFVGVSVGLLGLILGFCVENPPQMGLGDPNVGGFGGGSPFLGGFDAENSPEIGGGTPIGGGVWEGPHFWGSLGVFGG